MTLPTQIKRVCVDFERTQPTLNIDHPKVSHGHAARDTGTTDRLTILHAHITQRIHARQRPLDVSHPHNPRHPTDHRRQLGAGVLCTDDQRSKDIIRSVKGVEPLWWSMDQCRVASFRARVGSSRVERLWQEKGRRSYPQYSFAITSRSCVATYTTSSIHRIPSIPRPLPII